MAVSGVTFPTPWRRGGSRLELVPLTSNLAPSAEACPATRPCMAVRNGDRAQGKEKSKSLNSLNSLNSSYSQPLYECSVVVWWGWGVEPHACLTVSAYRHPYVALWRRN